MSSLTLCVIVALWTMNPGNRKSMPYWSLVMMLPAVAGIVFPATRASAVSLNVAAIFNFLYVKMFCSNCLPVFA